jgi:hypothetical protein
LTPWITTTSKDEIIEFKEGQSTRQLNSLVLEAETTDLYIRLLPSDYCLYIGAGESRRYDLESISAIQVMGNAGQKLRWSGMFW